MSTWNDWNNLNGGGNNGDDWPWLAMVIVVGYLIAKLLS